MTFDVRFSAAADDDLASLFDFLLDKAETLGDLNVAQAAIEAVRSTALMQLAVSPYSFRKAGASPTRRELIWGPWTGRPVGEIRYSYPSQPWR